MSTLVDPENQPALSHLLNQPMSARELISSLKSVGANFFPEEDAGKYVSVTKKRSAVEQEAYRSMALASSGLCFQWSRWNGEVSSYGKVVLRVAERGIGGEIDKVNST